MAVLLLNIILKLAGVKKIEIIRYLTDMSVTLCKNYFTIIFVKYVGSSRQILASCDVNISIHRDIMQGLFPFVAIFIVLIHCLMIDRMCFICMMVLKSCQLRWIVEKFKEIISITRDNGM